MDLIVLNKNDTWETHRDKLIEEAGELVCAIENGDRVNIAEKSMDVIQVVVGILDKLNVDMEQVALRHQKKLINREWKVKKIIEVR